jgi:hypothetical protein
MRTRQGFSWFAKKRRQPVRPEGSAFPPKECMLAMDLFCDLEPAALAAFERQTEMRAWLCQLTPGSWGPGEG